MSNDSKKEEQGQNPSYTVQYVQATPGFSQTTPGFVQAAPGFAQATPGFSQAGQIPFFYVPQQTSNPFESMDAQSEENGCKRTGWGCRRSGWCKKGGCSWKDDGRSLGTTTDFIANLIFGSLFPIFSLLVTLGMETSKLARIGVIFGQFNFFVLVLAAMRHIAQEHEIHHILFIFPILSVIFFILSIKSWCRFSWIYRTRPNRTEDEKVKGISISGSCHHFWIGFLASFFLSLIGTAIVLIARRNVLRARYGALLGMASSFIAIGIFMAVQGLPAIPLTLGLFLAEISIVHFRRAIITADLENGTTCV